MYKFVWFWVIQVRVVRLCKPAVLLSERQGVRARGSWFCVTGSDVTGFEFRVLSGSYCGFWVLSI